MQNDRSLSPQESAARLSAQVAQYLAQGYRLPEIAELLGERLGRVQAAARRNKKRVPAEDTNAWRQVELLNLERYQRAAEAVLEANHIIVSNGHIITQDVLDEGGRPIWDPVYGPDGEQLTDIDGAPRVEKRRVPLADNGVVLDALAELRKIGDSRSKLMGLPIVQKQQVELQHVSYAIEGVDPNIILGLNRTPGDEPEGNTGES